MQKIFNSFVAQLFFILLFSFIYSVIGEENYNNSSHTPPGYISYLNLATTIQAGVGFSSLMPNSPLVDFILILQQMISMGLNIIIYWYFHSILKKNM